MIGPNCLGTVNTDPSVRLNASFAAGFPPEGPVASPARAAHWDLRCSQPPAS